jgi:hypothetical protein
MLIGECGYESDIKKKQRESDIRNDAFFCWKE